MNKKETIKLVNEIFNIGKEKGILHLTTEDEAYNGRTIKVHDHVLINFGSYAYMGLNLDERIINGAVKAIKNYGTQYPSSRAYVSNTLYEEFEQLLEDVFEAPLIISNSTTLGHQAVMPTVIERNDLVILDHHVHSSVQESSRLLKTLGIKVSLLRHNDMESLNERIIEYSKKYDKIWYMADGVYSMYGDFAPVEELERLLNKHEKFYLYIDDAHGVSWAGKNGQGYVLSKMKLHKKMILAASLNKAFSSGGAVFVSPDEELKQRIRNCGGNLIFGGQLPSSTLGGGIEAAKIHLSPEIYDLQEKLHKLVCLFHELIEQKRLPIISDKESPIKFIGLGKPKMGYNLVSRLINDGFYVNLAIFPAVSSKCTGLRITITVDHSSQDIIALADAINEHYYEALEEEDITINEVYDAFKGVKEFQRIEEVVQVNSELLVDCVQTIHEVPKKDWNKVFGDHGMYDWEGLRFMEATFQGNPEKENNWDFNYCIIRDHTGRVLLATFFSIALSKDDLLASYKKSIKIEEARKKDPNFLVSKVFMLGSLITEGNHLYLDRTYPDWQKVLHKFLSLVRDYQEKMNLDAVYLRDFDMDDKEIKSILLSEGFLPVNLPNTHELDLSQWSTPDEYLKQLNHKKRYFLKKEVLNFSNRYEVELVNQPTRDQIEKWYQLYLNVQRSSFELNGFDLPISFFQKMAELECCDVIQIRIKSEYSHTGESIIVSSTFNYISEAGNYCGIVLGLDYSYVESHNLYKQTIYQSIMRAKELKSKKMYLGLTAGMTKSKFGASSRPLCAFIQVNDTYGSTLINFMNENELIS